MLSLITLLVATLSSTSILILILLLLADLARKVYNIILDKDIKLVSA